MFGLNLNEIVALKIQLHWKWIYTGNGLGCFGLKEY
jgi:hypothetical protein